MHLREGVIYVDRSGNKRGPLTYRQGVSSLCWVIKDGTKTQSWTRTGAYFADGRESEMDLVGEWSEPAKDVPIDLVPLSHFRRGVAKLFDAGRLY